jgi:hypothetical protein
MQPVAQYKWAPNIGAGSSPTRYPIVALACGAAMSESQKARAMGFNHVAIEVGDIDKALAF